MNKVPTHSSSGMSWSKNRGWMELSTLGVEPGEQFMSRAWSDSCDVGFWLQSHKTGQLVLFLLETQHNLNGEIVAWELTSQDGKFKITVVND